VAALLLICPAAAAQTTAIPNHAEPVLFPAVQFGAPARLTGGLAVLLPYGDNRSAFRGQGVMLEGSAGQSGARASGGVFTFEEYFGLDARAVLQRTWGDPLRASTDSTYLGVEGGVSIAYVRVSAGVARRISGPSGAHATILMWSAGIQFPIGTGS
jgi:hypothetical protein